MSIVPCLLTDKEPDGIAWPDVSNMAPGHRELKVLYSFAYVPAGFFNRLQVRLFTYGDEARIWKLGSWLQKNGHIALVTHQPTRSTLELRVRGIKPENIVYLIHESIETLVNESFASVQYDFSFPCPDCVEARTSEPWLFSSTLLRRASEIKAPFLQCSRFFHIVSIEEMLAVMPIVGLSSLDLSLANSLRDLKHIKTSLKYDVAFWYCGDDVPSENNANDTRCNPLSVVKAVKFENYKVWYSKAPKEERMDKVTYAIKESKLVILGVSEQVKHLMKNALLKRRILFSDSLLLIVGCLQVRQG